MAPVLRRDREPVQFITSILQAASLGLLAVLSLFPVEVSAEETAPTAKSQAQDDKDTESAEEKPEPAQGALQRLEQRFLGATPEERARLDAERERLSKAGANFGVDPTTMVGFYQLRYRHTAFTNSLRSESVLASVRLPITPNWVFQVNMPYLWTDPNQPRESTMNGASDMTIHTGMRVYQNKNVALLVGFDASFPTASEKQLGTGKYTLGPNLALAVPLPRMRSAFYLEAQDFTEPATK